MFRDTYIEQARVGEVAVVDDHVGELPWPDLIDVDQLRDVIAIAVKLAGLLASLSVRISGDTPTEGQRWIHVNPDAKVPAVVVLPSEREDRVDDEHTVGGSRDRLAPMIGARQGIMRAKHDVTGSSRPGREEEQLTCGLEVVGVPVIALPAQAVIPTFSGLVPGVLEVIDRCSKRGAAQSTDCGRQLMTETRLA